MNTNKKTANHKYIFVVGGVMSGVGKGVTTASLGTILQSKGYDVSLIKADPYLNVDAGTMNPTEHGEVFVLDSGMECDQDMGNYERFLHKSLPQDNYMTNGQIFQHVIQKERALEYDGKCVEPTYHITEEIHRRIGNSVENTDADITIVEIGGTIGEYQNAIFIEAARRLELANPDGVMFVMVSYLPIPDMIGEMKTKPTQNAVTQMNSYGVHPDVIIGRSEKPVDDKRKQKISDMCGVPKANVISAPDVENIYEVPVNFEEDGLSEQILDYFDLEPKQKDLKRWRRMLRKHRQAKENEAQLDIAIAGKYFDTGDFVLSDAYISVIEAINISAGHKQMQADIHWLDSKEFAGEDSDNALDTLDGYDGVIVPGGFGKTGIEGKINVIEYVRTHGIPYFGLCYGMQLALVEYARNVLALEGAHTTEIDPETPHPVIDLMPEQIQNMQDDDYGGTMRLGAWPCMLERRTIARSAYRAGTQISERHRHRYEVNPEYIDAFEDGGITFSGVSPDEKLMEIAELDQSEHPFFVGTQFHPEFQARPLDPHPLFTAFIKAAYNN